MSCTSPTPGQMRRQTGVSYVLNSGRTKDQRSESNRVHGVFSIVDMLYKEMLFQTSRIDLAMYTKGDVTPRRPRISVHYYSLVKCSDLQARES